MQKDDKWWVASSEWLKRERINEQEEKNENEQHFLPSSLPWILQAFGVFVLCLSTIVIVIMNPTHSLLPFSYTHNEWLLFVQKSIYYYSTGRQTVIYSQMHALMKQIAPQRTINNNQNNMSTSLTNFPSWRQKTECYTHNKERQLFFEWLMNWRKETSDWKMTKGFVR